MTGTCMKTYLVLALCLLPVFSALSATAEGGARTASEGKVGVMAGASRLEFEGNRAFSAERLQRGLRINGDWLQAAHPEAPLADYVKATQSALVRGYQHAGFPLAKITETRWLSSPQRLLCVIEEGPRYTAGEVSVTGAQSVPAEQIIKKLTTTAKKRKMADEPTSIENPDVVSESSEAKMTFRTRTTAAGDIKKALWIKGKPAPLDDRRLVNVKESVEYQLSQAGRMQAKVEVETVRDDAAHTAALRVKIVSEGPAAVLGEVACTGLKRDTEAELLKYLGLEKGRPIKAGQMQEIEDRLLNSARYVYFKATAKPRKEGQPEMDLKLELVEMPEAPRLVEPLNTTHNTLVKMRKWIDELVHSGSEDLVVTVLVQPKTGVGGEFRMIYNAQQGLLMKMLLWDDAEKRSKPRHCTLRYTPGQLAAFLSAQDGGSRQWLQQPIGANNMLRLFVNFELSEPKNGRTPGSTNFGMGFKERQDGPMLDLELNLKPAALLLHSLRYAEEWSSKDGLLVMKSVTADGQGGNSIVIDEATGQLREVGNGEGAWNKGHTEFSRYSITTAKGAWEKAAKEMDAETAGLANSYEAGEGLASWAAWLTAAALNSGIGHGGAPPPEEAAQRVAAARELGRRMKLSAPRLFSAFDSGEDSFDVPEAADKPSNNMLSTTMVALLGLQAADALFSEGTWPWLLAREVYYGTTGQNQYDGRILKQVQQDPQLGPVGSYLASLLLDWTLPAAAAAADFRQLALQKLSAADFRQDWGLLMMNCPAEQREAMSDLLEKVRAGSQTRESGLLKDALGTQGQGGGRFTPVIESFLQELRREPDRLLSAALTAAMDRVWDETLSGVLRDRLTPKGKDGKAVDAARVAALVGDTEVTRREVADTLRTLSEEPRPQPGVGVAQLEKEALESQIEVALLHAAFKAMGNTVRPEVLDADVSATVKKKHHGSRQRFLLALAKDGYSLEEYRMTREKALVAEVVRKKVRGMALQPTKEEIARVVAQENAAEERQVKLHTLTLFKHSDKRNKEEQRKLAEDLREKLKAGQDFEALAKKYSADSRAADGGASDWLNPAVLSPEIAKPLAEMKPGGVSAVLDLGAQWLIVKFDEERLKPQDTEKQLKAATVLLQRQKETEFYDAWLKNMRSKIKIQILPPPEPKSTPVK